jgi:hypothetical protein
MPPKLPHKTPRGTNSLALLASSNPVIRQAARWQRDRQPEQVVAAAAAAAAAKKSKRVFE